MFMFCTFIRTCTLHVSLASVHTYVHMYMYILTCTYAYTYMYMYTVLPTLQRDYVLRNISYYYAPVDDTPFTLVVVTPAAPFMPATPPSGTPTPSVDTENLNTSHLSGWNVSRYMYMYSRYAHAFGCEQKVL